jgi:hypothetical protein
MLTQSPHNLFGMKAFSIKIAYLTRTIKNILNDKGCLGKNIFRSRKLYPHKTW